MIKTYKYEDTDIRIFNRGTDRGHIKREGLQSAYIWRSKIPGLDYLENYIEKEDLDKYIIKV